ncbi:MAG: S8 family serine peptidase [Dokdonella sp.]
MKTIHIARSALAVAIAVAIAGANAATVTIAPHAPSPDEITDSRATDGSLLLLRSGLIDPLIERVDYSATGAAADVVSARYGIVQFQGDPAAARARLEKDGIQFLGYVPNNAYQVRLDGTALTKLQNDSAVRWVGLYQPGQKLDPALWTANLDALPEAPQGGYEVDVFGFAGESADQLAAALLKVSGVRIISVAKGDVPFARAHAEKVDLGALIRTATAEDSVAWVAPHYQEYVNNSGGISAIQGNTFNTGTPGSGVVEAGYQPMWDHNLFGSGQVISISDSGLDANEAWFTTLNKGVGDVTAITFADAVPPVPPAVGVASPNNKVYGYWVQPGATAYDNNVVCPGGTSPTSWHGTHTSGTIAGDAGGTVAAVPYTASTPTSSGHELADGMAPNAQLLFQDIGNDTTGCLSITDLGGTIRQAHAAGAGIHSASWGSASAGVYSGSDRLADNALSVVEDLIFVVSAGNSGAGATTTGSPGNGKNVITVGALAHSGSRVVASYSSRGPTTDGRVKPDIMAPGSSTISASGDTSTTATIEAPLSKSLSGTSMAAPTIAGNAGLMRQYFMDGFYPRGAKTAGDTYKPSGMAMKAVLLNGTNPLLANNTTPTDQFGTGNYGWGRGWLDGNLWFSTTLSAPGNDLRRMRLFERTNVAGVKTGDSQQYTIANVQAGQELRATLTWYDPEPSAGAALTLVNNLDLEVDGPGGTYKGNVFTSGVSTTGGSADVRNTVEQVRLTAPVSGSYTFRVKATNVPGAARENTNRQGYALAVSGAFGLPDAPAFAAPSGLAGSNAGGNVAVSFSAAGGAQGFQLYRASGTCATAPAGNFRLVGSSAISPAIDTTSQGGYSYAYKVRGISNDVEGALSSCIDVTSTAACTLQPTFNTDGLQGGATPNATCQVGLAWAPATSNCPAASAMNYSVQRSTDPYFAGPVTIASGVATASYSDFAASFGKPYYYKVLATDAAGNAAPISAIAAGTAIGPNGIDGNAYLDDGDTHVFVAMDSPWQVTNTQSTLGNLSYHSGADGGNYPASTCGSMTTAPIVVQAGANLNYQMKYNIETGWDLLVQEISLDNGVTWSDLPPTGGYPASGTLTSAGSACGFAVGKQGFGGSTSATPTNDAAPASFQSFSTSMAAYSGQTVRLRWRFSSDGGYEVGGAFLDQITLSGSESDRIFRGQFESTASSFTCTP